MHFSYVKENKEMKGKIEKGKMNRKRCMPRTLACSFKRSCRSIVKSRDELVAERDNAGKNKEQSQPELLEETESLKDSFTGSEIQGDQASQCSSFTEEEKAVTEEKVALPEGNVTPSSPGSFNEFQYKPASVPERNRFQAGITFVDSQGYIYAQEVKEGKVFTSFVLLCVFGRGGGEVVGDEG